MRVWFMLYIVAFVVFEKRAASYRARHRACRTFVSKQCIDDYFYQNSVSVCTFAGLLFTFLVIDADVFDWLNVGVLFAYVLMMLGANFHLITVSNRLESLCSV
jgi:hypothetical protein